MGMLISVNAAVPRPNPAKGTGTTGIDKRPIAGAARLRAPGQKTLGLGSGVVGDEVFDIQHHGGDDQAVYAYAREDLDEWGAELGRQLAGGVFGENITTAGIDVTGALVGERWRIGRDVVLEVTLPRTPCATFAHWMDEPQWIKRFTARGKPGSYLKIVEPGDVVAGDPITVIDRPDHDVSVGVVFRALTLEPELLPRLLAATTLDAELRERVLRRMG